MFHVEQRAVEYLFHVERGARCGENLRRRFNCNEINLPIDVATRRSRALVHNGVASTAQWQANFSAGTVGDYRKRGTCVALESVPRGTSWLVVRK
jgi:hypothetical protein